MTKRFSYGASLYPEVQTPEVWKRQLDAMKTAGLNTLRLADSSWGNLEPRPGEYDFDWLRDYMDLATERGFEIILGTGSFIAPLWLSGSEPEVLVETAGEGPVHPHSRKACCLNAPLYRERVVSFLHEFAPAFKDHPAVVAWQIDNEIDSVPLHSCTCIHCEQAWTQWLKKKFKTPEAFNDALELRHWGMSITDFEHLPMPRHCLEGPTHPHALHLQFRQFERDFIFDFLGMQAEVLRDCGVKQPFLHDWLMHSPSPQNDPRNRGLFQLAGLNVYPQPSYGADAWARFWLLQDMARYHGKGEWLCTETLTTACGSNQLGESPTPEQFRSWMLQMVAFGANGLIYWSGNRLRGGHWPYWGGLFDWTDEPEPELEGQVTALGKEMNESLLPALETPVQSRAAILYDYDQAWSGRVYPHTPAGFMIMEYSAQCLRRTGLGVSTVPAIDFEDAALLSDYQVILLAGCATFDSDTAVANLEAWVKQGGILIVGPMACYQSPYGVFRQDGLGGNLKALTGCFGRSVRKIPVKDAAAVKISGLGGGDGSGDGASDREAALTVEWENGNRSEIGLDGWCELLDVSEEADVTARYSGDHAVLAGRAAAVSHSLGQGSVLKLGFWPRDDAEITHYLQSHKLLHPLLSRSLPPDITAVPREDGSLWIINPLGQEHAIEFKTGLKDRLSGNTVKSSYSLKPYEVLWVDPEG